MKIYTTAESTIDLQKEMLKNLNIKTVPFGVCINDVNYYDGEISSSEIIESVTNTSKLPKTNAVNTYQYVEFFNEVLKECDYIIHFSLSSEISCAYNNALLALEEVKNVYVINTYSLSTGIALLVLYAQKLIKLGKSVDEIVRLVNERIDHNQTSFVLKRLDYLFKGGRCSALSFLSASLLKIRPQIVVKGGKMSPKKKYVGKMDKVIYKYVTDTLNEFNTPDLENVFITYTTCEEDIIVKVKNILKERGFKNIYITNANATITSHCGEGCFGILYLNDGGSDGVKKI